jgi:hypothetical protein
VLGYLLVDGRAKPRAWKAAIACLRSSGVSFAAGEIADGGPLAAVMPLKLNVAPANTMLGPADVKPGPAPAADTFSSCTPDTDVFETIESELTEHVEKDAELGVSKSTISVFKLEISVKTINKLGVVLVGPLYSKVNASIGRLSGVAPAQLSVANVAAGIDGANIAHREEITAKARANFIGILQMPN